MGEQVGFVWCMRGFLGEFVSGCRKSDGWVDFGGQQEWISDECWQMSAWVSVGWVLSDGVISTIILAVLQW